MKSVKSLNIIASIIGVVLVVGGTISMILAAVMDLAQLIWPLFIGAIILGIAFAVWKWFAEQAKFLWRIDLFKKISQTVLLACLAYIPLFYLSYSWLVPNLVKSTGLSYYHALILVTLLQTPIAGTVYYLVSPIWPEKGNIYKGFWIISIIGPLAIAYVMYQTPYRLFDHETGESKFYVSDSEERVYHSPGYGLEDGKPLRPGTAEDVAKLKEDRRSLREYINEKINKWFGEGAKSRKKTDETKLSHHLSGIFKVPASGAITDKDAKGRELRYYKGERIQLRQLNSPPEPLTFINHEIPSWTRSQRICTSGAATGNGKVELMSPEGKSITVQVRVIPPHP